MFKPFFNILQIIFKFVHLHRLLIKFIFKLSNLFIFEFKFVLHILFQKAHFFFILSIQVGKLLSFYLIVTVKQLLSRNQLLHFFSDIFNMQFHLLFTFDVFTAFCFKLNHLFFIFVVSLRYWTAWWIWIGIWMRRWMHWRPQTGVRGGCNEIEIVLQFYHWVLWTLFK